MHAHDDFSSSDAVAQSSDADAGDSSQPSFFITAVDVVDSHGNVPGFTILTSNVSGGVSEQHRKWHQWKELCVSRLFKIDGEA